MGCTRLRSCACQAAGWRAPGQHGNPCLTGDPCPDSQCKAMRAPPGTCSAGAAGCSPHAAHQSCGSRLRSRHSRAGRGVKWRVGASTGRGNGKFTSWAGRRRNCGAGAPAATGARQWWTSTSPRSDEHSGHSAAQRTLHDGDAVGAGHLASWVAQPGQLLKATHREGEARR